VINGECSLIYATGYARGEVRGLFDNPPRVDRNVRGGGGKGKKVDEGQPEGRVLEEVEIVYLATEATAPQGMQKVLCEAFGGSFWEPQGERKWTSGSVWELVYGGVEKAGRRRAAGSKWFHLSATSEVWAKDLARNICAARGCSTEKSRAMRDFVGRVFKGVDAEGPVRKRHFVVSWSESVFGWTALTLACTARESLGEEAS